ELDEDYVLNDNEQENEKQIEIFVSTAKTLFAQDNVSVYSDAEIAKWLIGKKGHRGKALEALAETLNWRRDQKIDQIALLDFSDLQQSGKLQFCGRALDGSAVLVWTGSRHVQPKTQPDWDRELKFLIHTLEKARNVPLLQKHYPERLSRMYIFPSNAVLTMMFNMTAKMLIDPQTLQKIHLKESGAILAEWISSDNYFERYGGTLPDPFE
ncbi:hypothetical protein EDD86DRAFT_173752, partial [Gorgonomyces haynaldii]